MNEAPRNNWARHQANIAITVTLDSTPWFLDSGASHHVASDLNNIAFYALYDGNEELIIGDGTGPSITFTGSIKSSNSSSLILNNVLCVLLMSKISYLYLNYVLITLSSFNSCHLILQ